jgi:2',5'-phosphodiesterase
VSPLKSAYFTKYGREPDFTNYAKVKEDPTFIDTLDYIFYSSSEVGGGGSVEVKDVLALPNRELVPGPLPNDDEPSDHLLMAADFVLN